MLFKKTQWDDVASGKVRVAYRRWTRPMVKKGGTLRTPLAVLEIDEVTKLPKSARITKADAAAAGFASVQALRDALSSEGDLYRVRFHPAAADARAELRASVAESDDDVRKLEAALAKLDGKKPWTLDMLALLDAQPATRAAQLAAGLGRETLEFKEDVRKLKALGLTESLDVGYRLSERGRAWLARHRPLAAKNEHALPDDVVAAVSRAKRIAVRAGGGAFTDVWPAVVGGGRVFVRNVDAGVDALRVQSIARGKAPTFRDVVVRAVAVADARLLDAIDAEYRRKYTTKNAVAVVDELCTAPSRAHTFELLRAP